MTPHAKDALAEIAMMCIGIFAMLTLIDIKIERALKKFKETLDSQQKG